MSLKIESIYFYLLINNILQGAQRRSIHIQEFFLAFSLPNYSLPFSILLLV